MEPEKLNAAIVGRCSQFTLNSVDVKSISKRLLVIGEKEKFKWLDKELSLKIAEHSNGSVRQAVTNLESVSQFASDSKKLKDVDSILSKLLGVGSSAYASDLLIALYSKKLSKLNDALLSCDSIITAINKMSFYNLYVIDCLMCPNNKKVAHWGENKKFRNDAKKYISDDKKFIKHVLDIQDTINTIKMKLGSFMSNDRSIALAEFSKLILK